MAPLAPTANCNNLLAGALARGVALGLFVLAFAPLILVTPAHATDDNTVSIAVDQNAALQPAGNLYKATTNVTVKTGKPYGFNLTMQADTADLVNAKDSTHKISATPSSTPVALNANQWGYSLNKSATTFSAVPAGAQATPAVVADVTKAKPAGCTNPANCTKQVTFAANVDPAKLASGSYSTTITYTATAKPAPKPPVVDPTVCKSGDPKNDCQVDIDPNMVPVKYTGSTTHAEWTSVADPEAANSGWYDYAYREDCGLNRDYRKGRPSNQGTWATHPAFTFGTKELNGIWFAKFETTGTTSQPTVLPNEAHISGDYSGMNRKVGNFYSLSKTLGVNDPQNVGGGDFTTTQNNHNLAKLSSHMVNNNDWGAAAYLSASKYGAGYNGVQINANATWRGYSSGTTGCSPQFNGNTVFYDITAPLGTPQACGDVDRSYNGTLGQFASTTNNPTGIYDMSGGGGEFVAASYTSDINLHDSSTTNFSKPANPPYVNNYSFDDLNECTFKTCGGQALYEANDGIGTDYGNHMWNGQYIDLRPAYPWFMRGGVYYSGSGAGLFYADDGVGDVSSNNAFRVALAPAPHD